ncbi:cation diffusion facilitator family transporter [Phytohalomonas tamaricis]|uniref:cation diffusion facilitator family transporter n=1 Tax=Phytohalomonas tamaricis TaxID=2081032 RepID=UPI000D0AD6DD|nr:cation diffusion facilitator family transporter [Phytohalomonas tamaricis]
MPHSHYNSAHTREAQRVTFISAILDGLLGLAKLLVGAASGSTAMIADGIHSLSDLVTDVFVMIATHYGRQAPDSDHPYGHWRIETLCTLGLGSLLIAVAGAFAWDSVQHLFAPTPVPESSLAIMLTLLALLIKEALFRYTLKVAKRQRSALLEANAWHSRSDALSSLVVLIGLIGVQFGLAWLDPVAAIVVALLVAKIGWQLLRDAGRELIDTALPEERQQAIRDCALSVAEVHNLHDLRTRTLGGRVSLDLHLLVDAGLSVSEGHEIGNEVTRRIRQQLPEIYDITFHIDPEDDSEGPRADQQSRLPLRDEIETTLESHWRHLPVWQERQSVDLHYVSGPGRRQVDVALFLPADAHSSATSPGASLAVTLSEAAHDLPWLGEVRVWISDSTSAPARPD